MTLPKLNRRRFLRGAGGIAIALPLLDAFRVKPARGNTPAAPKRFVVFFSANGTIHGEWTPKGTESSPTFGKILAPLSAHQARLLVLSGVDVKTAAADKGNGHARGMGHMLTGVKMIPDPGLDTGFGAIGYAGGISIDQAIAQAVGAETKYKSLEFGVRTAEPYGAHPYSRMVYAGPQKPIPAEDSPRKAFDRLFGDVGADPTAIAKVHAQRKSVLDFVSQDFKALDNQVSSDDRVRLEAHANSIREIEKQLDAVGTPIGASCAPKDPGNVPDPLKHDNFPLIGKLQMDILAMALACDLTRVGSLQWSSAQSGMRHTWAGVSNSHHGISHEGNSNGAAQNDLVAINTWYAKQLAYLADALAAMPEGQSTVLDNSVLMWTTEVAVGNTHSYKNLPYVLVGGCGGALKTGRHVTLSGRSHCDLFVTLQQAMGMTSNTFGDPSFNSGPIESLLA